MRVVEPVFAVKALHHVHLLVFESILVMRCLAMAVKVVESLAVRVQRVGVVFVVVQLFSLVLLSLLTRWSHVALPLCRGTVALGPNGTQLAHRGGL